MRPTEALKGRAGLGLTTAIIVAGVIALAAVAGLVVAFAMSGSAPQQASEPEQAPQTPEDEYVFVDFGSSVANLAEGRLTRYVKVDISLQVKQEYAADVTRLIGNGKKAVFMNWLVTYLSDKQLQDVKGTTAINRLRREIQDGFNSILARYGDYKVEKVYFKEFNVQ